MADTKPVFLGTNGVPRPASRLEDLRSLLPNTAQGGLTWTQILVVRPSTETKREGNVGMLGSRLEFLTIYKFI